MTTTATTIIPLTPDAQLGREYDVYIGWAFPGSLRADVAAGSVYASGFDRRAWSPRIALVEYEALWRRRLACRTRRRWLDLLTALRGKRLACPCGDAGGERCHGSVLVRLVEEFCQ